MSAADVESYSKFYREAAPRLVAFLIYAGSSASDAADCAQDALEQALPPRWSTLDAPYAFCRVIANRRYLDICRRRKSSSHRIYDENSSPLIADPTAYAEIDQLDEVRRLLGMLDGQNQRLALALSYDGATPAEIAVVLGMGQRRRDRRCGTRERGCGNSANRLEVDPDER